MGSQNKRKATQTESVYHEETKQLQFHSCLRLSYHHLITALVRETRSHGILIMTSLIPFWTESSKSEHEREEDVMKLYKEIKYFHTFFLTIMIVSFGKKES